MSKNPASSSGAAERHQPMRSRASSGRLTGAGLAQAKREIITQRTRRIRFIKPFTNGSRTCFAQAVGRYENRIVIYDFVLLLSILFAALDFLNVRCQHRGSRSLESFISRTSAVSKAGPRSSNFAAFLFSAGDIRKEACTWQREAE
jgi:hypothetical protein